MIYTSDSCSLSLPIIYEALTSHEIEPANTQIVENGYDLIYYIFIIFY